MYISICQPDPWIWSEVFRLSHSMGEVSRLDPSPGLLTAQVVLELTALEIHGSQVLLMANRLGNLGPTILAPRSSEMSQHGAT